MVDSFQAPGHPAGPPSPPPPPAAWYPDGAGGYRYWDGARWTAHHPASAMVTGPALAPWGRRIPAFIIDMSLVIPGMVFAAIAWIHEVNRVIDATGNEGTAPAPRLWGFFLGWLLTALVTFVNRGVVQGLTGRSLGKAFMKLRVVRLADGAPPGLGWGLLRMLIEMVAGWIDIIVAFVNDRHQRLGDLAGKTIVVENAVAAEMRASHST